MSTITRTLDRSDLARMTRAEVARWAGLVPDEDLPVVVGTEIEGDATDFLLELL